MRTQELERMKALEFATVLETEARRLAQTGQKGWKRLCICEHALQK